MYKKLKREVKDLDNVRAAMKYLAEVREKEGQIEQMFGPVQEMYDMLQRCVAPRRHHVLARPTPSYLTPHWDTLPSGTRFASLRRNSTRSASCRTRGRS